MGAVLIVGIVVVFVLLFGAALSLRIGHGATIRLEVPID